MIETIDLNDKTYADLLEEAIAQIPLYGSEWTNFNVSDPGVTILQNLTSFNYLQQTAINTVTDETRQKLLALLGFRPQQAAPAEILAAPLGPGPVRLTPYRKFSSGGVTFEAGREEICQPWGLAAAYREEEGVWADVTSLLDRSASVSSVPLFGAPPRAGASFLCVLEGEPDLSRPFLLYAETPESGRNPFAGAGVPFATIDWQVYTAAGWQSVAAADQTHGFLVSGAIALGPAALEPAVFTQTPINGYALRCRLTAHEYDLTPRLRTLAVNLTRLRQRDTKAALYALPGGPSAVLRLDPLYSSVTVYGRTGESAPYRLYQRRETAEKGRYFTAEFLPEGETRLLFTGDDSDRPGSGPEDLLVVCATEESERSRALGPIYGYVDQEITIDADGWIIPEELVLLLETGAGPEKTYETARPGLPTPDGFLFELLPGGKICVRQPEISGTCAAYIAACAVTLGAEGNLREGNVVAALAPAEEKKDAFLNPAAGRGGLSPETTADLRQRFTACLQTPWAAVTAADYEELVRSAPGLCIHKVKALPVPRENLMRIVVKPGSEERFPRLPDSYIRRLSALLNERRMLTAAFALVQPEYIPVNVQGSVQVKSRFAGAGEEIERALRQALDFVSTDVEFGTPVLFNRIFAVVSRLPCVAALVDLALTPGRRGAAVTAGMDVVPEGHCLCYPGSITLDIITRDER
ncbi:MAG: baseplate J/gp47 family protein [Gracilibacteraceae bacterium]|jgi:hypothetical protein|nr:baseplate J/gp47 family protein [Gracilibacteraceae bacterium]